MTSPAALCIHHVLLPVQMENGCILNSTYPGGCALPNGNGPAPPAVQMPVPDTLSGLSDPPATGFYLWPPDQEQILQPDTVCGQKHTLTWSSLTSRHPNKQSRINVGLYVFLLNFHFGFETFFVFFFCFGVKGTRGGQGRDGEGVIVLYFKSYYHMSPLFTIMQSRVLSWVYFKWYREVDMSYRSTFRYNAKHCLRRRFWRALGFDYLQIK